MFGWRIGRTRQRLAAFDFKKNRAGGRRVDRKVTRIYGFTRIVTSGGVGCPVGGGLLGFGFAGRREGDLPIGTEIGYMRIRRICGNRFCAGFGVRENEDTRLVGSQVDGLGTCRGRGEGGVIGVPSFCKFVCRAKASDCVDGLIAGIDDEVNVCALQLAANESELILRGVYSTREIEVWRRGNSKSTCKPARVRNECGLFRIEELLR